SPRAGQPPQGQDPRVRADRRSGGRTRHRAHQGHARRYGQGPRGHPPVRVHRRVGGPPREGLRRQRLLLVTYQNRGHNFPVSTLAVKMDLPSDADRSGRDLGVDEIALLREVIESGTLNCTKGTQVKAFEREFAARYGMAHARAVTSGTAAIHTAVAAIDPEPGDGHVTRGNTDMWGIAPILYQQAIPIFADVDPVSLNVTPETVAERLTSRTRAIIVTHLFGSPCDVVGIKRIADAKGIPVIEDCAQAYLATQSGRLV